ncbi:MAG: hypothetical protein M3552_22850 [Planctomycetota bacterium]|nr:hypothetical protein [Planctomycetaceae bacterium]MDQ3333447.1 hypothetical protein [Planctomycetota bacterium]
MLSGYPVQTSEDTAAELHDMLVAGFNRADSNLVGNVVTGITQMIPDMNAAIRETNPPQGLPAWRPQSIIDGFDATVRAAESEVYGLEGIFTPSLSGFTTPFAYKTNGGWSTMGPPFMQGYRFYGMEYLPDGY